MIINGIVDPSITYILNWLWSNLYKMHKSQLLSRVALLHEDATLIK
jgi:hypothetical protein